MTGGRRPRAARLTGLDLVRIVVIGLSGAGKTTLANQIVAGLCLDNPCIWLNADHQRKAADDWDFTPDGRKRQAVRLATKASAYEKSNVTVVIDFVCPLPEYRSIVKADVLIYMESGKECKFEDTKNLFQRPTLDEIRDLRCRYLHIENFEYDMQDIMGFVTLYSDVII